MARATNDDSTGLPPGFSYLDPPPNWPPRPAQDLKLMAQRLQQLLDRDKPAAPSSLCADVDEEQ
jgi:hypothetical protein